jgi:multiple sugar transport system permease protein
MSAPAGLARPTRKIPGLRRRRRAKDKFVRPKGGRGADALTYLAFLLTLIFFGGPLLWILSLSLKTVAEVNDPSLRLIPQDPTLENYTQVLSSAQFPTWLFNSAILSLGGSLGAMFVAAPAAYAFSRFRFRGKTVVLIAILALQMIAPLVLAVPLYRYFARIDLLDSHLSTTMVYIAILMPLATWMLKGFFDEIPKELDEAAMVDGATRFQAFFRVILPVAMSGVTAVFLLMAILAWGEFVVPFILLSEPALLPVSVGILNFQGTYATTSAHILAAGGVMAMLPAIAIFVLMQRFIIGALTGAVKG